MRVYLETLGCRLNYAEIATLGRQLVNAGHELARSAADADLCVLNSCAVTGEAARKSRQLARQLAQSNPAARLVVTGCYATLEADTVSALPNVSLVVGNAHKDALLSLIAGEMQKMAGEPALEQGGPAAPVSALAEGAEVLPLAPAEPAGRTRAFVKVQDGCRNHCTFCIVTVARGEERSRPVGEVVAEINQLEAADYREAVLTGVHLGGYGRDLGENLPGLIAALLAETSIPRLRLSSLEPFDLGPQFFDLWAQSGGRLMPHLHLPAQSGSDTILRRMARRNRVADFEALVAAARARIPDLMVTTDLIVGFPGETEREFGETVDFARRVGFAHLHVFPYSARAGTAAARFGNQAPVRERRRRSHLLNGLDAELGRQARAASLGQVRPVLWENRLAGPELQALEQAGALPVGYSAWSGLTDNYLRVTATVPASIDLHNRITPTRLFAAESECLRGEVRVSTTDL